MTGRLAIDLRRALSRGRAAELTVDPLIDAASDFADAVADSVGKSYNLDNPRLRKHLEDYARKRVAMINRTTRDQLIKALDDDDPVAAVRRVFEVARTSRAKAIAVGEVGRTSNFAALDAGKWQGALDLKRFASQQDGHVRSTHVAMHGQVVGWNEDFISPSGARGKFPGSFGVAEEDVQCFPGDVPVSFAGLRTVYRRWYEGDLAVLTLDDGRQAPVTPNHPFLTEQGWRPARALEEGEHLISEDFIHHVRGIVAQPDPCHSPMMIEEVHRALTQCFPVRWALDIPTNFHGDGRDGQIDVVFVDRHLRNWMQATSLEHALELALAHPHDVRLLLGAFDQFCVRTLGAADSIMRRFGQALALLCAGSRHPMEHAFAAVPGRDPRLKQASPHGVSIDAEPRGGTLDAERSQSAVQGAVPDVEALTDLLVRDAFGGKIKDHRVTIVGKTVRHWAGSVFNLETEQRYYSAMGVVCHNCRCAALPARRKQAAELDDYGDAVALYEDLRAPFTERLEAAWQQVFDEQERAALALLE